MSLFGNSSPVKSRTDALRPPSPKLGGSLADLVARCFEDDPRPTLLSPPDVDFSSKAQLFTLRQEHRARSPSPPPRVATPITAIRSPTDDTFTKGFLNGLKLDNLNFNNGMRRAANPVPGLFSGSTIRPDSPPITPCASEDEGANVVFEQADFARDFSSSTLSTPTFPGTPQMSRQVGQTYQLTPKQTPRVAPALQPLRYVQPAQNPPVLEPLRHVQPVQIAPSSRPLLPRGPVKRRNLDGMETLGAGMLSPSRPVPVIQQLPPAYQWVLSHQSVPTMQDQSMLSMQQQLETLKQQLAMQQQQQQLSVQHQSLQPMPALQQQPVATMQQQPPVKTAQEKLMDPLVAETWNDERHFVDRNGKVPEMVFVPIRGGPYGGQIVGAIGVPNSEFIEPLFHANFYPFIPQVVDHDSVSPSYVATKEDKKLVVTAKLFSQFRLDQASEALAQSVAVSGLHIFVDLSNITIGFYDCIKQNRGIRGRVKVPPFSFDNFAHILERNRSVAKKIIAGSVQDSGDKTTWPQFMIEAEASGYEMNVLSRVTRTQPGSAKRTQPKSIMGSLSGNSKRRSRRGRGGNSVTPEPSSATEGAVSPVPPAPIVKNGEQAVDEVLHLKMMHSVLDDKPGTMVLATGDAAEAEFSDGFLKHAERALKNDWRVELYAWSSGIAVAWRDLERSQKYGDRFRIVVLDDFVEELHAVHLEPSTY